MLSLFPEFLNYQQLAPFLLRAILALIFMGNGYYKLFKSFKKTSKFFGTIKIRPAKFWTGLIGIVEILVGIMLGLGFLTQLAAMLAIAVALFFIFIKNKVKQGLLGGYDFDLLILICALSLLFLGPGVFSIDIPL
ncbi:MAG: DoxX family protein [Patescibacteria group bacterium]